MNKEKIANALKYSEEDVVPKIVAQGSGHIADKIISIAKENDIAIYKDEKLAYQLKRLELGKDIPPELYEVVAQVLIYISKFDK